MLSGFCVRNKESFCSFYIACPTSSVRGQREQINTSVSVIYVTLLLLCPHLPPSFCTLLQAKRTRIIGVYPSTILFSRDTALDIRGECLTSIQEETLVSTSLFYGKLDIKFSDMNILKTLQFLCFVANRID